jgi:uncharacterized protein
VTEALRVEHDGVSLAGSYTPAGDTVVIALHGASRGERSHYEHLHRLLPPVGIGVVTFDRRGDGESTGEPSRGRFDVQTRDALAVLEAVGAERAGFWGVSQGAWIGPLAAARSERVVFLVLLAATGVTPSEQMMFAVGEGLRLAGYGEEVVDGVLGLRRRFERWVHGGPADGLAEALAALAAEPWAGLAFLPPRLLGDDERRGWIEEMDFDPRPSIAQVRCPTLLLYGAEDVISPVGPNIAAWSGTGADIVVVDGADHALQLPDGSPAPEYERALVTWLLENSLD